MRKNTFDMKTQRKTKETAPKNAAGFERGFPRGNAATARTLV
jgi:hypothetical protein